MISSMTGFASGKGHFGAHSWSWELRAVNGKGQDIRIRVPDWITGLETHLRSAMSEATEAWQYNNWIEALSRRGRRRFELEHFAA